MAAQPCLACLHAARRLTNPPSTGKQAARASFATTSRVLLQDQQRHRRQFDTGASSSAAPTSSGNASSGNEPRPLPRPLGVQNSPKLSQKTWTERMLNQDERLAERKRLVKAASKGYFEDYNAARHNGGKSWTALPALIQEKKSLYFPEIEGTTLSPDGNKVTTTDLLHGKISLVGMLSTRVSEAHVASYAHRVRKEFKDEPLFQFVQINCQENRLKWILVSLFIASARRTVPADLHNKYLVSTQDLERLREPMGMTNKHIGYVYLVDETGKIRWAAVSSANTSETDATGNSQLDEVAALLRCTRALLGRLKGQSTDLQDTLSTTAPPS